MEQRYTVTQASEMLGVKSYVLRYWEDELELRIHRNEQGHRYYTGYDITLFANIKELKNRGLQLRAIKEVLPKLSHPAPGSTQSKIRLIEGEIVPEADLEAEKIQENKTSEESKGSEEVSESEKILEFQQILERLIRQELQMKREGEARCRNLDAAIRRQQLARKEAAASLDKKNKKRPKIHN